MSNSAPLSHFDPLIGHWTLEVGRNGQFDEVGTTALAWLGEKSFIVMRCDNAEGGPPSASVVIGADGDSGVCIALYHDARGVSRVYVTSFQDGVWRMRRDQEGFKQLLEARLSEDGQKMVGKWQKNTGDKWEHDFDVIYTRTS